MEESQYAQVAGAFVRLHPPGQVVTTKNLVDFAKKHGNGLATDLLVADPKKQRTALVRHLNTGGASHELAEEERFRLVPEDAKLGTSLVMSYADFANSLATTALERSMRGAVSPVAKSHKAIQNVKIDEILDDDLKREMQQQAEYTGSLLATVKASSRKYMHDAIVAKLTSRGVPPDQIKHSLDVILSMLPKQILKLTR